MIMYQQNKKLLKLLELANELKVIELKLKAREVGLTNITLTNREKEISGIK